MLTLNLTEYDWHFFASFLDYTTSNEKIWWNKPLSRRLKRPKTKSFGYARLLYGLPNRRHFRISASFSSREPQVLLTFFMSCSRLSLEFLFCRSSSILIPRPMANGWPNFFTFSGSLKDFDNHSFICSTYGRSLFVLDFFGFRFFCITFRQSEFFSGFHHFIVKWLFLFIPARVYLFENLQQSSHIICFPKIFVRWMVDFSASSHLICWKCCLSILEKIPLLFLENRCRERSC